MTHGTVTTEQAAMYAGVSTATIRSWVLRGQLEPVRRGVKPLRFRYDDVAACQLERRTRAWHERHADAVRRWRLLESGADVCNDVS